MQIGIHGLFDEPPSLVVSGINIGYNHGAAFLLSSGTVGAAVEAWVSGIPSIAISAGANGPWGPWRHHVHTPEAQPEWMHLADMSADLIAEVLDARLNQYADVVTINVPFDATRATRRCVTTVARVGYDRLFSKESDCIYTHDFGGGIIEFDATDGTDIAAAADGCISITPLLMPAAAAVPDTVRARLER